jgi:DNA topoisomerase-6 subunit B
LAKKIESAKPARSGAAKITTSSTAEYFAKNLQQVGFSSPTKAVLTTLKEAVDNSLDACEENDILPEVWVKIAKVGAGSLKNTDRLRVVVTDNGPGLDADDVPKVFGEYLASSKFGRGRCSRGQQGIGISAATTWAVQTTATGARVTTKTKAARKAFSCLVDVDLKNNKGIVRDKQTIDWDKTNGTQVEFLIDGRLQLNGDAGILNYLKSTVLLNPHLTLHYEIPEIPANTVERVSKDVPVVPEATEPHPHTMKLGEFISHARLYGRTKANVWLKKGFSRVSDKVIEGLVAGGLKEALLNKFVDTFTEKEFAELYEAVQKAPLIAPSTQSVLSVGEEGLALSIQRLGDIDFFSVLSRKPVIADFKPVQVEVAIARLTTKDAEAAENQVQVLRFANRVPLQFDKASCAIVKALCSVNWKTYGLRQPKNSLPLGPYIFAVSVVSPFIKFKNASKETIDASDELVEELRRALIQAGQRLSRYLNRESKAEELEQKIQHIEKFGPILVDTLCRILAAPETRKNKAREGLEKILGRDARSTEKELATADHQLAQHIADKKKRIAAFYSSDYVEPAETSPTAEGEADVETKDSKEPAEAASVTQIDEAPTKKGRKVTKEKKVGKTSKARR